MADPIQRGITDPQLQRQHFSRDWQRGATLTEEWRGLNPGKMAALYNGAIVSANRGTLSVEGGRAEMSLEWGCDLVTGSVSGNSLAVTIDRWECPEPRTEKPVFAHPAFIADAAAAMTSLALTVDDAGLADFIQKWNNAAANHATSDSFASFLTTLTNGSNTWAAFAAGNPAAAGRMCRRFLRVANNQTHYQSATYALRHTTNAPAYFTLNVSDVNVNRVYTTAQLMSEACNGSLWFLTLPGRLQYKLMAAAAEFNAITPVRANYQIGWLKSPSSEASVGRNRTEIQTNYVLDQWNTDDYPLAT